MKGSCDSQVAASRPTYLFAHLMEACLPCSPISNGNHPPSPLHYWPLSTFFFSFSITLTIFSLYNMQYIVYVICLLFTVCLFQILLPTPLSRVQARVFVFVSDASQTPKNSARYITGAQLLTEFAVISQYYTLFFSWYLAS